MKDKGGIALSMEKLVGLIILVLIIIFGLLAIKYLGGLGKNILNILK